MPDSKETITIENVVASTAIEQELDLETLETDLPGADYDPDRFPGLIYRSQEPKATSLIFRSGKIVTTGGRNEDAVNTVLENLFEDLAELGISVPDEPAVTIQNIVSGADLGQPINLNAIAIGLGLETIEYEPEQFPGLVYRLDRPSVVVLLFGSGKLVITGGKTTDDAAKALDAVTARLTELGLLE